MTQKKNKIDISRIDLDKMEEMTTDQPGLVAFPHSVGGAVIKPEDQGKMKGRSVSAMRQQTERQMQQLYEQAQTLARQARSIQHRVEVSERIYVAQMNFEPIIGHTYYFYERADGTDVLSMVSPSEWGRRIPFERYVAEVTLLSDHTWEVKRAETDEED